MWWRRLLVLALGGVLLSLASCQAADPGQMDLVFRWPDGAPSWSAETPYSLWGRMERWPGGEPAGAVLVGEATGPTGKTYAVLGESAEALSFAQVPYGDGLVVVIAVRQGAVDGTPSEGDELVYYGHSNPFSLEPGDKVTVEVDLELQPAPGAGTEADAATFLKSLTSRFGMIQLMRPAETSDEQLPQDQPVGQTAASGLGPGGDVPAAPADSGWWIWVPYDVMFERGAATLHARFLLSEPSRGWVTTFDRLEFDMPDGRLLQWPPTDDGESTR